VGGVLRALISGQRDAKSWIRPGPQAAPTAGRATVLRGFQGPKRGHQLPLFFRNRHFRTTYCGSGPSSKEICPVFTTKDTKSTKKNRAEGLIQCFVTFEVKKFCQK
jgi:hypothetical protein